MIATDERSEELYAELQQHRLAVGGRTWPDSEFAAVMPALPLFHRLGRPLSTTQHIVLETADAKSAREALGTDMCVFASVGFAVYLMPPVVLAFGPMDELRDHRMSAPWDTRGVGSLMGWNPGFHADMIERYSLPGGVDEAYLARSLATLFESPAQFVRGDLPTGSDILGVIRTAVSRTNGPWVGSQSDFSTPEARFTHAIDLDDEVFLAAFVDVDALDARPDADAWKRTVAALRRRLGPRFFPMRRKAGAIELRGAAVEFTLAHLRQEGVV